MKNWDHSIHQHVLVYQGKELELFCFIFVEVIKEVYGFFLGGGGNPLFIYIYICTYCVCHFYISRHSLTIFIYFENEFEGILLRKWYKRGEREERLFKIINYSLIFTYVVLILDFRYFINCANIIYIYIYVGNRSRKRPEGSLFDSYYSEVLGRAQTLSLDFSTLPLIRTLYCWVLSKVVSSTIFKVFGMTQPWTEPRSPGPLTNTLPSRSTYIYIYIYIYMCVCVCVC